MASTSRKTFSVLFRQLHHLFTRRTIESCKSCALFYSTGNKDVSSNPFYEKYADKLLKRTQNNNEENTKRAVEFLAQMAMNVGDFNTLYEQGWMQGRDPSPSNFDQMKEPSSNLYDKRLKKEVDGIKAQTRKSATVKRNNTISPNSQNGSPSLYGKKENNYCSLAATFVDIENIDGAQSFELIQNHKVFAWNKLQVLQARMLHNHNLGTCRVCSMYAVNSTNATVSNDLKKPSSWKKREGLGAIMHLEKVEMESAESIKKIWKAFHSDKDCVSAVLPSSMYDIIQERARKYPVFVYPVPRDGGYELMVGEFFNDQCYVTSVLTYQTLGENAPWLVAFTHFTELKESKGIVLMVGEIDARHIATHEAMFIANLIQLYYGTDDDRKLSLLRMFNTEPDKFDHMSVVREMERSTIHTD